MVVKDFYNQKLAQVNVNTDSLRGKLFLSSIFRLLLFVSAFIAFILLNKYSLTLASVVGILLFSSFLSLVVRHLFLTQQKIYWDSYKTVIESEIKACGYNYNDFRNGEPYINHRHEYSFDLDIFGRDSIFQMINRTVTHEGEKQLVNILNTRTLEKGRIIKSQETVKELVALPELMLQFRATGKTSSIEDQDIQQIIDWTSKKSFISNNRVLRVISFLMPSVLWLVLVFAFFYSSLIPLVGLIYLLNMLLVGYFTKNINREHQRVSVFLKLLQKYQGLLTVICCRDYKSGLLKQINEELSCNGQKADVQLKMLNRLVGAFDSRLNLAAAIFLEGFLMWDFHCLYKIDKWRNDCGSRLPVWLKNVSYFDALISLGSYAFLHPEYVYPDISDETVLDAGKVGHPPDSTWREGG